MDGTEQPRAPEQQPHPPANRHCVECKHTFATSSEFNRHMRSSKKHNADKAPLLERPSCGVKFCLRDSLRTHIRTQHEHEHRYRCVLCLKGFESAKALAAHNNTHTTDTVGANVVMPFVAERNMHLHAALVTARTPKKRSCGGKDRCKAANDDRTNPEVVFACAGECKQLLHWECVGYDRELQALPAVICPSCLISSGRSIGTAGVALDNRRLLEKYVAHMKCLVVAVPADGTCLLKCVAKAVNESHTDLFLKALGVIPTLEIPDDEAREAVVAQCQKLLDKPSRRLGDEWDSLLFEYLPQAFAIVTGRPLHIFEVFGGCIKVQVLRPDVVSAADVVPIMLIRSLTELGLDHYDLVLPAADV